MRGMVVGEGGRSSGVLLYHQVLIFFDIMRLPLEVCLLSETTPIKGRASLLSNSFKTLTEAFLV